jgi:hypothetical protein
MSSGEFMPPTVIVGNILMKNSPAISQLLGLESEPYTGNWNLIRALDSSTLDRKVRVAGWNFFFMASVVEARFLGELGAEKIQKALQRILNSVAPQNFNCLEVTGMATRSFLGLPYSVVSAHSRHMQESCYLDPEVTRGLS